MSLLLVLSTAVFVAIIAFYQWQRGYWKRRGINGPEGSLFLGIFWNLTDPKNPGMLQIQKWTKQYGKVYGIQDGIRKYLVVSDVDMLHDVFVKKFDYFYGRKNVAIAGDVEKDPHVHVLEAQGARWKRLRTIAAPTFSSGSLRKVCGTVEDSAKELVRIMEQFANGDSFDIHLYFQKFTFDVICRIAMGQERSMMGENPLLERAQGIFIQNIRNPFFILGSVMPYFHAEIRKLLILFARFRSHSALPIINQVTKAVDERIAEREEMTRNGIEIGEPADYIDLFLDAKADEQIMEDSAEYSKSNVKVSRKMSREEIIRQCFLFLLAGYDTTSNSLSYTSFLLAKNPRVMKKLQEEIEEVCGHEETINYDKVQSLKYMDYVIKETLRLYPLAALVSSRRCMKSTRLGDYEVKEGEYVVGDIWSLHYDTEIWGKDAAEFVPERWENLTPKQNIAWIAFGAGPRLCIGQRLAYLEAKLALTHILRRFDMVEGPNTESELKLVGSLTVSPNSVNVYLKTRTS